MSSIKKILLLMMVLFVSASCSQLELFSHSFKEMFGEERVPVYKVGKPYKIDGKYYYPAVDYSYSKTGIASWYGKQFHDKRTANGEIFNMNIVSAAHKTLPMPSLVRVTNLENGRSMKIRVNDRGPFVNGRIIDLSRRAAQLLGFEKKGTAMVRVEIMMEESQMLAMRMKNKNEPSESQYIKAVPRKEVIKGDVGDKEAPSKKLSKKTEEKDLKALDSDMKEETMASSLKEIYQDPVVKNLPVGRPKLYIQTGAFKDLGNAKKLHKKISSIYNAIISTIKINNEDYHRVRMGPFDTIKTMDIVLKKLINTGHKNADIKIIQ